MMGDRRAVKRVPAPRAARTTSREIQGEKGVAVDSGGMRGRTGHVRGRVNKGDPVE